MRKLFFILAFVAVITNANAQSKVKVSGSKPKVGNVIHGVVKDSLGPMESVQIIEFDTINQKIVAQTLTDKNGHFSIELVNDAHIISVAFVLHYYDVSSSISGSKYEFFLRKVPESRRSINTLDDKFKDKPLLLLDGEPTYKVNWDGFDKTKESYSKKEISDLMGIDINTIVKISVLQGESAMKEWGTRAKNGVIQVQTKRNDERDRGK